jgi:hypothetical protein
MEVILLAWFRSGGQREENAEMARRGMGVHSLARLPVRRRTETDETEEDRREQNRKGGEGVSRK